MIQTRWGFISFMNVDRQDHLVVKANPDDRSILYM